MLQNAISFSSFSENEIKEETHSVGTQLKGVLPFHVELMVRPRRTKKKMPRLSFGYAIFFYAYTRRKNTRIRVGQFRTTRRVFFRVDYVPVNSESEEFRP